MYDTQMHRRVCGITSCQPDSCAHEQVANGDCPHTLFNGPSGAGKKTLILGLLKQIYGAGVERLKVSQSHDQPWLPPAVSEQTYHCIKQWMHMHTFDKTSMACVQVETRPWTIELPSRKLEIDLTTVSSNHHVELNPSDAGNNDRYVVQEVIKVSLSEVSGDS